MTSYFDPKHRVLRAPLAAAALLIGLGGPATAAEGTLSVPLDKAELVRLDAPAADVVVGNPSVADVSVQNSKLLVITGKSFGSTNLIVIGADGKEVLNENLSVLDPGSGFVTVHRGSGLPMTVYCVPRCNAPMAIGDDGNYFQTIQKEVSSKQDMAQSNAQNGVGQQ
jgi:Pilus formation protein N terminal region